MNQTIERRSDRKHKIKGLLYLNISILITLWSFYISLFVDKEFNYEFLDDIIGNVPMGATEDIF